MKIIYTLSGIIPMVQLQKMDHRGRKVCEILLNPHIYFSYHIIRSKKTVMHSISGAILTRMPCALEMD
jgi:hypothetical protein